MKQHRRAATLFELILVVAIPIAASQSWMVDQDEPDQKIDVNEIGNCGYAGSDNTSNDPDAWMILH